MFNKEIQTNIQNGLTKELMPMINMKSIKMNEECCSCELEINKDKYMCEDDEVFDDGTLIAIIDSFSSFAIMYLIPNDNYKKYLSLSIKLTSFDEIKGETEGSKKKKVFIYVKLIKKVDRDVLLGISVCDEEGKEIKYITHLKRKIMSKL